MGSTLWTICREGFDRIGHLNYPQKHPFPSFTLPTSNNFLCLCFIDKKIVIQKFGSANSNKIDLFLNIF